METLWARAVLAMRPSDKMDLYIVTCFDAVLCLVEVAVVVRGCDQSALQSRRKRLIDVIVITPE